MNALRAWAVGVLALTAAAAVAEEPQDWQKAADEAPWRWSDKEASVWHSFQRYQGDYQLELVKKANRFGELELRVAREGKAIVTFPAHPGTGFILDGDTAVFTAYRGSSTGCALTAFDLKTGKKLWETSLRGIGPISHFGYSNAVTIDEVAPGVLRVYGNEAGGQYVEFVDLKTGKTVGHKKFPQR